MRTTLLPPHIAAQTFASQPVARPQPPAAATAAAPDGFQALALKSAAPGRVITPRVPEQKPAPTPPAPVATPPAQAAAHAPSPAATAAVQVAAPAAPAAGGPAPDRLLRPGSRLDIRV